MNTIKVSDEHLQLIQRALDLYLRCSIGQFEKVAEVSSVQNWLENKLKTEVLYFDNYYDNPLTEKLKEAKMLYTGLNSPNGSYGVFNPNLDSDVQDIMNIHDQIRHHLWKKSGAEKKGLVMEYDAMKQLIEIE